MRWLAVLAVAGCPKGGAESSGSAAAAPPVVFAWAPSASAPQPELLGQLMTQFYNVHLLLAVARTGDEVTVTVATADGAAQDACVPTTTLGPVSVGGDGAVALHADRVGFAANGLAASVHRVDLDAKVGDGALAITKASAVVDTREYLPLLGSGPDQALCDMMPAMGACAACPDGADRCWAASFSGVAERVEIPVVARSEADVCADPACAGRAVCAK